MYAEGLVVQKTTCYRLISMKFVVTFLCLLCTIALQSQNRDVHIILDTVEELPVCSDCSRQIKEYIDQHLQVPVINERDTIICSFTIDSLARIRNIEVQNTPDAPFVEVITAAVSASTEWMPAFNRGMPVSCTLYFKLSFRKNGDRIETNEINLPGMEPDKFTNHRMEKNYLRYFEENSGEKISHLDAANIVSYALSNFHRFKEQGFTESIHFKTSDITIKNQEKVTSWALLIPKFKIYSRSPFPTPSTVQIENIPVKHEIIFLVVQNVENKVLISLEKFEYHGQKSYLPVFKEYTFNEFRQRIETYAQK